MSTNYQFKERIKPSERRFMINTLSVHHTGTFQASINGHGINMSERSSHSLDGAIIKLMRRFKESGTEGVLVR